MNVHDGQIIALRRPSVETQNQRAREASRLARYMQLELRSQDFWLLDLTSMKTRPLTKLTRRDPMPTFDITPDRQRIVFGRQRENSDIVLIDIPK